jgi:nitrogen fixation/metabolism regulation signal transduction histidine kinase
MQQVDLGALLQDVLALYDNLRPHVSLSLPSAPAVIEGEPTRLRQVLHNLLQNAIDAQIDVERPRYDIALDGHGDEVTLSFGDAGAGFSDEVLRRAFEPYVTTKSKGTGLGLAIVRKIVDEHHGRVTLGNREPHGAHVAIAFPRGGPDGVG